MIDNLAAANDNDNSVITPSGLIIPASAVQSNPSAVLRDAASTTAPLRDDTSTSAPLSDAASASAPTNQSLTTPAPGPSNTVPTSWTSSTRLSQGSSTRLSQGSSAITPATNKMKSAKVNERKQSTIFFYNNINH